MDPDELQKLWRSETERMVARSEVKLTLRFEARSALARFSALLIFELVVALGTAALFAAFVADHWGGPWFALAGAALLVAGIAQVAASVLQFAMLERIDRSAPVIELQKRLEGLKALRLRYLRASFVVGLACWAGFMAVIAAAVFGIAASDAQLRWWAVLNTVIALAFIPLFLWVSRQRQWFLRLRREVAGKSLMQALAALEDLAKFEREPG